MPIPLLGEDGSVCYLRARNTGVRFSRIVSYLGTEPDNIME
jgi:hypothetical protein